MVRSVEEIIERQMHRWRLEHRERAEGQKKAAPAALVITMSNAEGALGDQIARTVAATLGVPFYDREIVEHISRTADIQIETVETLDDTARGRFDDYIASLFHERGFDQGDYFRALTRTITALWAHGPCVLLGRGAGYIIDRKHALAVRVEAPTPLRIKRVQQVAHLSHEDARRRVERADSQREAFIRHFFDADIYDPVNYDLVLNTGRVDPERCVAVVIEAYRAKKHLAGARPVSPAVNTR